MYIFFFQAEDGIRDIGVTGVQTCALPISFYIVTPPGINGTPPRSMPTAGASFGEQTWTRRLERDILDLIRKEKMTKPVVIEIGRASCREREKISDEYE